MQSNISTEFPASGVVHALHSYQFNIWEMFCHINVCRIATFFAHKQCSSCYEVLKPGTVMLWYRKCDYSQHVKIHTLCSLCAQQVQHTCSTLPSYGSSGRSHYSHKTRHSKPEVRQMKCAAVSVIIPISLCGDMMALQK